MLAESLADAWADASLLAAVLNEVMADAALSAESLMLASDAETTEVEAMPEMVRSL